MARAHRRFLLCAAAVVPPAARPGRLVDGAVPKYPTYARSQ
jgi:hypothetical protein